MERKKKKKSRGRKNALFEKVVYTEGTKVYSLDGASGRDELSTGLRRLDECKEILIPSS